MQPRKGRARGREGTVSKITEARRDGVVEWVGMGWERVREWKPFWGGMAAILKEMTKWQRMDVEWRGRGE